MFLMLYPKLNFSMVGMNEFVRAQQGRSQYTNLCIKPVSYVRAQQVRSIIQLGNTEKTIWFTVL